MRKLRSEKGGDCAVEEGHEAVRCSNLDPDAASAREHHGYIQSCNDCQQNVDVDERELSVEVQVMKDLGPELDRHVVRLAIPATQATTELCKREHA